MASTDTTKTDTTKFICLFHDPHRGRAALDALTQAGFPPDMIGTVGKDTNRPASSTTLTLEDLGAPERDLKHLRDGLNKGGVILALEAPEDRNDEIERIFHKYSADKIDETDRDRPEYAAGEPFVTAESAVVPVVEEELVVGKREVDRGGVRVLRRVVEEPVAETLNLHSERVVIDRRPVDREVRDADLAAGDQVIELVETAEVPVVTKTSRVVEEVRVGLEATDRTQTVEDTVRHTEVDLESVPEPTRNVPRS